MPTPESFNPPSVERYVAALKAVNLTDYRKQMLQIHYDAPQRTITATKLAEAMGFKRYTDSNRMYGGLASQIGKALDYSPEPEKLGTIVTFEHRNGEWHWILRPEVAQALEILGIVAAQSVEPSELTEQRQRVEADGYFDPSGVEDARQRVAASIIYRRGQSKFRRALLEAYGSRCLVTGCDAEPALEAAHIVPYLGAETNHVTNGLLLRADIHTLFDLHLLSIQPETKTIVIASSLESTAYKNFASQSLKLKGNIKPSDRALAEHYQIFLQK